jgi:hypothetical protein
VTKRSQGRRVENKTLIDQNIANSAMTYRYTVSGKYIDNSTDKMEEIKDTRQHLYISLSFKKVDGEWKIYRVSTAMWDSLSNEVWED